MNKFIPKKLLALTVFCETISRMALIFALFQIPVLVNEMYGRSALRPYILHFLILILLFALFHFLSQKSALNLGGAAKRQIRAYFQKEFLKMPPVQDRAQKGMPLQELPLHYMKAADLMEPWYSKFLPSQGVAVIVPFLILFIMFFEDKLTFLILFVTGILLPVFLFLIGKAAKKKSEEQWQSFAKLRAFFLESLQGYKTIKIFKKMSERERDLEIAETEFGKKTMGVLKTAFLSALVQEWAGSISIAMVAVSLALRLMNGAMDFSTAFAALLITPEFYRPIRQFGLAFHAAIDAKTAFAGAQSSMEIVASGEWLVASGKVDNNPQLTYITGPSGSGKTNMILGMLSEDVAYMSQTPVWFSGTLYENLCPVEPKPLDEVKAALESVNLGHFMERLNEQVQEYAANFSGGEKRRLALARVILLNRKIWLLDEPFAGLDKENVQRLEKFLESESKKHSIVCVTHHR